VSDPHPNDAHLKEREQDLCEALIWTLYVLEEAKDRRLLTMKNMGMELTDGGRALAKRMFAENRRPLRADIIRVTGIDMGEDFDSQP
jgi:hypothetical protein